MTSRQPIAVLGATGNQGGRVARALLEAGWPVRAITRNADSPRAKELATLGAQVVQADMGDVDTLIRAFDGACGIFSVQNFWELGLREEVRLGTNVIAAAKAIGTPHVVYSSGLGADRIQRVAAIDGKAMVEERLRESGLSFTILRPGLFMDDFLGASLPFRPVIQRLFETHRPLIGRLFLSVIRDIFPSDHPVPLTTLQSVGGLALWAWENQGESNGKSFPVVGDLVLPKILSTMWTEATGQTVPWVPAIRVGLHLGHPQMDQLLRWLSRRDFTITTAPFALRSYGEWLHSIVG